MKKQTTNKTPNAKTRKTTFHVLLSDFEKAYAAGDYAAAEDIEAKDYPGNTSHFSVMDRFGNAVSQTQTIRDWFGSGIVVEGMGFVLNVRLQVKRAK